MQIAIPIATPAKIIQDGIVTKHLISQNDTTLHMHRCMVHVCKQTQHTTDFTFTININVIIIAIVVMYI